MSSLEDSTHCSTHVVISLGVLKALDAPRKVGQHRRVMQMVARCRKLHCPASRIRTTSKGLRGFLRDGFDNFFEVLLPAHSWVRVEKGFSVLDTALRTGLSWLCVLVKGQFSVSQIPSPHCLMNKSRSRNTSWRKQGPAAAMRSCYILLSYVVISFAH